MRNICEILLKKRKEEKGNGTVEVLLMGAIVIFILFPIFVTVVERYLILAKHQLIKDSIDITNLGAYYALESDGLGKGIIDFNEANILNIYTNLLAKNLNLDTSLNPLENSLIDSQVDIESIIIYRGDFPVECPQGTFITRPTIHSCIIVPIKPNFFRRVLKGILKEEYIKLRIHVDSEIPVNN